MEENQVPQQPQSQYQAPQPNYQPQYQQQYQQPVQDPTLTQKTISSILGIVSMVAPFIIPAGGIQMIAGIICGIVAIIMGIILIKKTRGVLGKAGLICGIFGLIINGFILWLGFSFSAYLLNQK